MALSGTGVGTTPTPTTTRIIGLSGTMAFGDAQVGTSATTTLTISNSGNSTLTWSGLSTGDGVFTASATSGTVAAGGSANVTLTFTPSAATSYSSTLTVTSDATSGTNTTTVSGTGTTAQVAETRIIRVEWETLIPDTAVGNRGYGTVRLHNDGNSVMSCEQRSASNAAIVDFNSWSFPDPSNRDLLAGQSATFSAEFIPTAAVTYTGTVTIGCANATSGSGELSYTATGTAAQ
jgi:hypothetical protein